MRPDRNDENPRFGALGIVRQWIESIYQTTKSQLSLELHGGHSPAGVHLSANPRPRRAGIWHSRQLWEGRLTDATGRHFTNYDH